jgi:hypothetical protein
VREDYVGLQVEQLFRRHPHPVNVAGGPTNGHAQVTAISPTQLRKSLREPGEVGLCLRIVFIKRHQHTDAPHALGLLRTRRERPCRRAAEQRDELAAVQRRYHSMTSSARTSNVDGTSMLSILAVFRLMNSSAFVDC